MSRQKELIPMNPGDKLRHEREKKGLTVEQAADRVKIREAILLSIESDTTDHIPPVYLRGYVRNYARFLGLNPKEVERHVSLHGDRADPEVQTIFTARDPRESSERWLKATSYTMASLLVAALVWQFTHEAVRFSQGERPSAAPAAATAEASGDGPAAQSASHLNASIASIEVTKARGEAGGTSAGQEAWAALGKPGDAGRLAAPGERTVGVSVSADSWIEIRDVSGNFLERDLIRAGNSRSYQGIAPFRVMLGRASAVQLYLDGDLVDIAPHTRGNVTRMTLGREEAAEPEPESEDS